MNVGTPRVYLAGPVTHSDDPHGWRDRLKRVYPSRIEWVDVLEDIDPDEVTVETTPWKSTSGESGVVHCDEIVAHDTDTVERCDAVLMNHEGVITPGSWMEVKHAADRDIPVVVRTHDPDCSNWVHSHANAVVTTFGAAIAAVERSLWYEENGTTAIP